MTNPSENELLISLAKHDRSAFETIYKLYRERLFRFALHYLNDEELAGDVTQDVFMAVWADSSKLKEVRNLSSWLYTLTKYHCLKKIDHIKVVHKHADVLYYKQLSIVQSALNDLDTSPVIFNELNSIIENTLEKLNPKTRQIFQLSRFENKKNREIADELDISIKTVESHLSVALKALRKALKNYLPLISFLVG